jgi:Protein of unknown function (DUF559)
MIYCHICKRNLKHMNAFLTHHRWHHNGMTTKEYYDLYLKKEGEGICQTPGCKNECRFENMTRGYFKHCSRKCSFDYLNKSGKIVEAKINKNGFYNNNRKQAKRTCLKKYGVENISQLEDIKEKKKETCLQNNGYEHWVGTKEHIEWMKNGGAAYCNIFIKNPSRPQLKLYKMVLELCPYAILNYPCLNYSIDIAIPFLNLAIEFDGEYWHKNKEKYDEKRQRQLEQQGWEFFRFSSLPRIDKISRIFK